MDTIKQLSAMQRFLTSLGYDIELITVDEALAVLNGLKAVLKTSEVLSQYPLN